MISLTGILSQALALSRSVHFCILFLGFKKFVLSVFWPLNVATSIGVMWRAGELFVKCSWLRFCWGMGLCTESEVGLEETGGQRWRCSMRPRVPSSAGADLNCCVTGEEKGSSGPFLLTQRSFALLNCLIWGNTSPCGECLWHDTMILNICFAFVGCMRRVVVHSSLVWKGVKACQNPAFYRHQTQLLCSTCRVSQILIFVGWCQPTQTHKTSKNRLLFFRIFT